MERRKAPVSKPSPLPVDYLKMVSEVFTSHFESGLKAYEGLRPHSKFEVQGEVGTSEIIIAVSLVTQDQLAATTVYASSDFDPQASAPTAQDLLSACVDAVASVFDILLSPERLKMLADESLSALENIPFEWAAVEADHRKIFVKIDKANLSLDQVADQWLREKDPSLQESEEEEQRETENLFVTGKEQKNRSGKGSGSVH